MTREHKLALIVGFSLILVVGMLVSDHLSKARQAKIASVKPAEMVVADSNVPAAADPLKALETLTPPPIDPSPVTTANAPNPTSSTPVITHEPASVVSNTPAILTDPGRHEPTHALTSAENDNSLVQAIERNGGTVRKDKSGNTVFTLPQAAETTTTTTKIAAKPASAGAGTPATAQAKADPKTANTGKVLASDAGKAEHTVTTETVKMHAVQKGETLFDIAGKYYGTGRVWRELAKYNNIKDKDGVVRVGMKLQIPSKDTLLGRETASEQKPTVSPTPTIKPTPGKRPEVVPVKPGRIELATYTVKRGDTLGVISQKVLGSSKRWHEIADLNKLDDEDNIPAGTVLKVPPMRG